MENLMDTVKQRASSQIDAQKGRATDSLSAIAGAVRQSTEQLRDDQHDGLAQYVEQAANQLERFANGLRDKSADELLRDVRNLARRQPALFIGGSVAVGILAARFLKSSRDGETREFYQGGYSSGNRPYRSSEAALSTSIPPRDFVADVDTDDVGRIGRERM